MGPTVGHKEEIKLRNTDFHARNVWKEDERNRNIDTCPTIGNVSKEIWRKLKILMLDPQS